MGTPEYLLISPSYHCNNCILYITMVSPIDSEEEGVPIPTNSSPSTNGRRRGGSRVLQSSLEIAFSCKSGHVARLLSSGNASRLLGKLRSSQESRRRRVQKLISRFKEPAEEVWKYTIRPIIRRSIFNQLVIWGTTRRGNSK
jgi:hypothetical protein